MTDSRDLTKVEKMDGELSTASGGQLQAGVAPLAWTRIGVGDAIRWYPFTFAIPVVLITLLAVLAGLLRTPDYTAEAKLSISESLGGVAGLAGFAANSESLAAGFSQAMDAPRVVRRIGRQLGLPADQVSSSVTASSTAGSPVLRVKATNPTRDGAIELANAASIALIAYLERINRGGSAGQDLLKEFRDATVKVNRLGARVKALKSSSADPATVNQARAARDAARLVARAASAAYGTSQENRASVGSLQVLSPAGEAKSDRLSKLELLIFIGLVVGIATGAALASIRANG